MKTGTKLVRWTTDNWVSNFNEMRYHLLSHHPASHFWGWLWTSLCPMCMHHSCCNLGLQVALGALILKCKIFKTNIQTYAVFNPVSLLLSILQCVLPLVEVPHWSLSYTCIELSYTRHLRVVYLGFPHRHVWELLPNENWFSAYHHYCAFHFCNKQLWKSTHEDLFGLMARMGSLHGWCSDTVSLWWFTVVGVQGYTSLLNLRRRSKQERQKTLRSDCTCAGLPSVIWRSPNKSHLLFLFFSTGGWIQNLQTQPRLQHFLLIIGTGSCWVMKLLRLDSMLGSSCSSFLEY